MRFLSSLAHIPKWTTTPLWDTYESWRATRNCQIVLRAMRRGRPAKLIDVAATTKLSEAEALRILRFLRVQDKVAPLHVDELPDESLWVKL